MEIHIIQGEVQNREKGTFPYQLTQTRQLGQMLLKSLSLSLETEQEDSTNDTKMNSKELGVDILNEEPLTPELSLNEYSFIGP